MSESLGISIQRDVEEVQTGKKESVGQYAELVIQHVSG